MGAITGNEQLTNLVDKLQAELVEGRAARGTFGARDQAFSWVTGLPSTIAPHVSVAGVEGSSVDVVKVAPAGTLGSTAPGASKPTWAALSTESVTVAKYSGLLSYPVENSVHSVGLAQAVYEVLVRQALRSFDQDVWALLGSDAGDTASAAAWSTAILQGIAAVASNGGMPNLLVISPTDYAAAVESPGAGYLLDPRDGLQTLFGLRIVVSTGAGAATGTAFVLDSTAVTALEDTRSPYVVVDPFGANLQTNTVTVAAEVFAAATVNAPGAVCAVTKTP